MRRIELLVSLVIGIVVGLLLLILANGVGIPTGLTVSDSAVLDVDPVTSTMLSSSMDYSPPTRGHITEEIYEPLHSSSLDVSADNAACVGGEKGPDHDDVLLLYDSAADRNFDINFCKLADYYGVKCKRVDLKNFSLTDDLLRDAHGSYFKLIGISARTLETPALISVDELDLLKQSVKIGGATLLVAELVGEDELESYPNLESLTDKAVLGVKKPDDSSADWYVSDQMPELTSVFTGRVISCTEIAQSDYAIDLGEPLSVTAIITSVDDSSATYPIFARYQAEAGSVLVTAGDPHRDLDSSPMRDLYEPCTFSELVPLMLAFRFSLGDEVWHSNYTCANLTIDDPALREHSFGIRYAKLLAQMKEHKFHTTIAFMPKNYDRSDPLVIRLFLKHPEYLSIVQHGNNNDLYEFYKYEVSETDPYPARPLAEQKADIVEGLARMEEHERLTGVPYGKIMIFPYGISPAPTLTWLKANNFNATINADHIPLGVDAGSEFDFDMYQAVMDYESFPSIGRHFVPPGGLSEMGFQWLLFDLFISRPILVFSHVDEVFRHGMHGFNETADTIHQLADSVEWHSLDYIVKHLYLQKRNDDGSIDVKWYGNHLIVENSSREGRTYHLQKRETLNVPIERLTVGGEEFPFRVEKDVLLLDLYISGESSAEVVIHYGP